MSEFLFDPEVHRYTVDGVELPSITQVMSSIVVKRRDGKFSQWFDYSYLKESTADNAKQRGRWVHDLIAVRLTNGPLPEFLITRLQAEAPDYWPFYPPFEIWLQRAEAKGFAALIVEKPMYSSRHRFAGTPDLVCLLAGRPTIIDLKTNSAPDETKVQTAAQALLLEEQPDYPHRGVLHDRFALALPPGGDAMLIPHRNHTQDRTLFLSALTLWQSHHEGYNGNGRH